MNQAVFISDLHLHALDEAGYLRFQQWVEWALCHTRSVYILGDFFNAWAGDDLMDAFELNIAECLAQFSKHDIPVFFMPGNRDFLVGSRFLKRAALKYLKDPTCISFGSHRVLLAHGDAYCKKDYAHQWFRVLTRSFWFKPIFLSLPKSIRSFFVKKIRSYSQTRHKKNTFETYVSEDSLSSAVIKYNAEVLIHGHTHQPIFKEIKNKKAYFLYCVLSDWEDKVSFLCYNEDRGFYFSSF